MPMDKLIYMTGDMGVFFQNEIAALVAGFDDTLVLTYGETAEKRAQMSRELGFRAEGISVSFPKARELWALMRWLRLDHVREERRAHCRGKKALKKFAYLLYYGLFAVRVEETLKKERFSPSDRVYLYSFWLSRGAYAAVYLREKLGAAKAVARSNGYDTYLERNALRYLPFRKAILSGLDAVYTVSDELGDYLRELCSENSYSFREIKTRYLGARRYGAVMEHREKEELVLASCSTVNAVKRLDLIIRLASEISKIYPNVRWVHIGDGELMDRTRELAEELLPGKYELTGRLENSAVFDVYRQNGVDFFVNLSDSEGFGIAIAEALSLGIPAVGRNVGGVPEAVGGAGLLLPREVDGEVLQKTAERLVRLFRDRAAYDELSRAACRRWRELFDAEANIEGFLRDLKS